MSKQINRETDYKLGKVTAKSVKTSNKPSGSKSPRVESDGKFGKRGK